MLLLNQEAISVSYQQFLDAIKIYICSPHVANKKVSGCVVEKCLLSKKCDVDKVYLKVENCCVRNDEELWNGFEELDVENWKAWRLEDDCTDEQIVVALVTKILPKDVQKRKIFRVLSLLDYSKHEVHFFRFGNEQEQGLLPEFPYKIQHNQSSISIYAAISEEDKTRESYARSCEWMTNVLLKKLIKWSTHIPDTKQRKSQTIKSLSQIDLEEYNRLYCDLKEKYSKFLFEIWVDECTDPKKFVFEDIAIASYLLLLWRKYSKRQQKFVDIGCGNGLLVYLLSSEGHQGLGIDLRKRKIWDKYPKGSTNLLEKTIIPSDEALFPDTDWIIGNHSDELSPWIPVIAARSSYNTKFFLLPCCAHEFDGQKYQRRDTGKSVYEDFVVYLKEISHICGFEIQMDRLKIPSTKRVAIIGVERQYKESEMTLYSTKIQEFIDQRSGQSCDIDDNGQQKNWVKDFQPTKSVQKINNCSQIDKSLEITIILQIFNEILEKKRNLPDYPHWNIGGSIALRDAIQLLDNNQKQALKTAAGGLKTLIKNNHNIFEVKSGSIYIRKPSSILEKSNKISKKQIFYQEKKCWFHKNHPQGCPLDDNKCSYKH